MWKQYRNAAPLAQIFIVAVSIVMYFYGGRQWFLALVVFLCMQIGALLGAFWAASLKRRIESARDRLPLDQR